MKRRWAIIAVVALLVFGLGHYAFLSDYIQDKAEAVELTRIVNASAQNDFSGSFVFSAYWQGGSFEMRMDVAHAHPDKTQFGFKGFRLNGGEWFSPDRWSKGWGGGQGQDWSKGWGGDSSKNWGGNWQKYSGDWAGFASVGWQRNWLDPIINPRLAAANYKVDRLPAAVIAGRNTVGLHLVPARKGPSFKLWVDSVTSLALAIETLDGDGLTTTRLAYDSVRFETPKVDSTGRSAWWGQRKQVSLSELKAQPPFTFWVPDHVPKGYELHQVFTASASVQLNYTDGMTILSLSQTPKGKSRYKEPAVSQEGTPVVVRNNYRGMEMLKVTLEETTVTLLGWEPSEKLVTVITSMKPYRAK